MKLLSAWLTTKLTTRNRDFYYVKLCKSAIFISGLAVTHKFVNYAVMGVFITYITDGFGEENIVHAAALSNLGEGLSGLSLTFFTAISASYACYNKLILSSTAAYVIGLILLCVSTIHYIPEDIYYPFMIIVVVLLHMGKTGSKPILDNFFREQLIFHEMKENTNYKRVNARYQAWRVVAWLLALVPILLTADLVFKKMLIVSSSMLAVSCLWFFCGTFFYHTIEPNTNPPIVAYRVLKSALLNLRAEYPTTPDQYFRGQEKEKFFVRTKGNDIHLLPDFPFCRWVDKAAIKSLLSPEEHERKCRTVTRVYETKHILSMIPIWAVFLGFGIAKATWGTFFSEQADNISNNRAITVTTLVLINSVSKDLVSHMCRRIAGWIKDPRRIYRFLKVRICFGMVVSTICFVVAWKIEETKPKNTWILVPQFFLSGLSEGLALDGLDDFYDYHVPKSITGYGEVFNEIAIGFGSLLSIICLYISRRNWFAGKDLSSSETKLDRYYCFITVVTIVYLLVGTYVLLALYAYNSEIGETVDSKLEVMVAKDTSEEEKRLHAQFVETLGIDPKNQEAGSNDLERDAN